MNDYAHYLTSHFRIPTPTYNPRLFGVWGKNRHVPHYKIILTSDIQGLIRFPTQQIDVGNMKMSLLL